MAAIDPRGSVIVLGDYPIHHLLLGHAVHHCHIGPVRTAVTAWERTTGKRGLNEELDELDDFLDMQDGD